MEVGFLHSSLWWTGENIAVVIGVVAVLLTVFMMFPNNVRKRTFRSQRWCGVLSVVHLQRARAAAAPEDVPVEATTPRTQSMHATASINVERFIADVPGESKRMMDASPQAKYIYDANFLGKPTIITRDANMINHFMVEKKENYRQRMGDDDGLRDLGMFEAGVIWNNNTGSKETDNHSTTWNSIRKIFEKSLADKVLQLAAGVGYEEVDKTVQALLLFEGDGVSEPHDVLDIMRRITLRITLQCFFSLKVQLESADGRLLPLNSTAVADVAAASNPESLSDLTETVMINAIGNFFKAWNYLLLRSRDNRDSENERHIAAVKELQKIAEQLWHHCSQASDPGIFIKELLKIVAPDGSDPMIHQRQACLEMLLAGVDTSSVTLFYALHKLASDQIMQQRMRTSLLQALADDCGFREKLTELSVCTEGECNERDVIRKLREEVIRITGSTSQATDIVAFLHETMRLKPVGPISIRQAEKDDVLPDGRHFPAGGHVVMSLEGLHKCPTTFKDPDTFEKSRDFKVRGFAPFGKGPKSCPGQFLAMREMCAILSAFMLHYSVRLAPTAQTMSFETSDVKWDIANQPTQSKIMTVVARKVSVILCGASSTGKTSLADALGNTASFSGFQRIKEVARGVMKDNGWSSGDIKGNENIYAELQLQILSKQLQMEQQYYTAKAADDCASPETNTHGNCSSADELQQPYISDRGLDALAYIKQRNLQYPAAEREQLAAAVEALASHYCNDAVVILLPVVDAFRVEDGTRMLDTFAEAQAFNDTLLGELKNLRIPVFTLPAACTDMRYRVQFVQHLHKIVSGTAAISRMYDNSISE